METKGQVIFTYYFAYPLSDFSSVVFGIVKGDAVVYIPLTMPKKQLYFGLRGCEK
jgi:hypothetical protein